MKVRHVAFLLALVVATALLAGCTPVLPVPPWEEAQELIRITKAANDWVAGVERYDIEVSPRSALARTDAATSVPEALGKIAALTGQDPAALMAILTADPQSDFAYLTKGVKLDVFEAIRALDIPWVYYELRPSRTYPNGAVAGNLVGFIGTGDDTNAARIGANARHNSRERFRIQRVPKLVPQ